MSLLADVRGLVPRYSHPSRRHLTFVDELVGSVPGISLLEHVRAATSKKVFPDYSIEDLLDCSADAANPSIHTFECWKVYNCRGDAPLQINSFFAQLVRNGYENRFLSTKDEVAVAVATFMQTESLSREGPEYTGTNNQGLYIPFKHPSGELMCVRAFTNKKRDHWILHLRDLKRTQIYLKERFIFL